MCFVFVSWWREIVHMSVWERESESESETVIKKIKNKKLSIPNFECQIVSKGVRISVLTVEYKHNNAILFGLNSKKCITMGNHDDHKISNHFFEAINKNFFFFFLTEIAKPISSTQTLF